MNAPWMRAERDSPDGRKSMSPCPSSDSAPFWSRITRESVCEDTANAIRDWCRTSGAKTSYIEPGSPWQNPFVESFGSRVRDEVLAVEMFTPLLEAKVVIGADGWASTVRRTAGLGRLFPDFAICAQYRLGNLSLDEPEVNEFHFGSKVAPGAFAYVFPKSGEVANVGVGVRRIHREPPIAYLKRFVGSDPRLKEAEIQRVSGGIIPASGVIDNVVTDGVMLVGDAAGQLIPLTGAGVHTGIVAGRIAGEVAARAAHEGEVSASRLSEYDRRFDAIWGKQIRDSRRVGEMLDRFGDDGLNRIAEVLTSKDVLALANGINITRVLAGAAMRSPLKFMRLVTSYLRG